MQIGKKEVYLSLGTDDMILDDMILCIKNPNIYPLLEPMNKFGKVAE